MIAEKTLQNDQEAGKIMKRPGSTNKLAKDIQMELGQARNTDGAIQRDEPIGQTGASMVVELIQNQSDQKFGQEVGLSQPRVLSS